MHKKRWSIRFPMYFLVCHENQGEKPEKTTLMSYVAFSVTTAVGVVIIVVTIGKIVFEISVTHCCSAQSAPKFRCHCCCHLTRQWYVLDLYEDECRKFSQLKQFYRIFWSDVDSLSNPSRVLCVKNLCNFFELLVDEKDSIWVHSLKKLVALDFVDFRPFGSGLFLLTVIGILDKGWRNVLLNHVF